jgi:hypothetical protein
VINTPFLFSLHILHPSIPLTTLTQHLYCVFTKIHPLLIDKDFSVNLKHLIIFSVLFYVYHSSGDLFIYSLRVIHYYSYLCVIRIGF